MAPPQARQTMPPQAPQAQTMPPQAPQAQTQTQAPQTMPPQAPQTLLAVVQMAIVYALA